MNIYDAVRTRRSVRAYQERPVEDEKLKRVLEAARLAPSGGNTQKWRCLIVTDADLRAKLAVAASNQSFIAQAPVVLVMCAVGSKGVVDPAIALDHVTLAAAAEDLGTCWIGAFKEEEVKKVVGVPEDVRVVMLMPIGYPADKAPTIRSRKPFEQLFGRNRWS